MASAYARGYQLEREVRLLFEKDRYAVIRGSSSKGKFAVPLIVDCDHCGKMLNKCYFFKPDLIASKKGRDKRTVYIVLMQAKRAKR